MNRIVKRTLLGVSLAGLGLVTAGLVTNRYRVGAAIVRQLEERPDSLVVVLHGIAFEAPLEDADTYRRHQKEGTRAPYRVDTWRRTDYGLHPGTLGTYESQLTSRTPAGVDVV